MMKRSGAWAGFLALLALSTGRADAAGISIVNVTSTGSSTSTLAVGDILTVDLVVNNDTNLDIYGIGLIAFGYDADEDGVADDGLRMIGAESTASIFNTTVISSGQVFGGLPDFTHNNPYPREHSLGSTGLQTQLTNAISLTPSNGDGSLDIGVGGESIANGDVHFRISFQATSLLDGTELTLNFGIGDPTATGAEPNRGQAVVGYRGAFLPFENASLRVAILEDPNAIPDPGTGGSGSGDGSDGEDDEDDEGSGTDGGSGGSGGSDPGSGTGGGTGTGETGTGGTGGETGGGSGNGSSSTGGGTPVPAVPEPGAALLFGAGLATVGLARRR